MKRAPNNIQQQKNYEKKAYPGPKPGNVNYAYNPKEKIMENQKPIPKPIPMPIPKEVPMKIEQLKPNEIKENIPIKIMPEELEKKEENNIEDLEIEDKNEDEDEKKKSEIIEINKMRKLPKKEITDSPEYNKLIINILGNLPESKDFYSKIEKDKKGKINPRIPGIFIMFDNINFYFQHFQKYKFFEKFSTSIPKNIDKIKEPGKLFSEIEEYIKKNTNIQQLFNTNKISMDDIISDYILYFIEKRDKLTKDSCDIKYIYKILFNLIQIKKKNSHLDGYKYFIEIIILFNCFGSHLTYPLNAIKYLNDEKIVKDIYKRILKEIEQYEKENNIIFIIIESFFNVLVNEILSNNEIISKLYYIHLFIMNIINILDLPNRSFYVFMQLRSFYNLNKEENNKLYIKETFSHINELKDIYNGQNKKEKILILYNEFYEKIRTNFKGNNYNNLGIFIVDFFTYELKKYQENEELFPIILDVLTEDHGSALKNSNKIFNIFLKKYVFENPPKNEEECINILKNTYTIKKEIKYDNIKLDKNIIKFKENIEEIEIKDEINNEIKEKNLVEIKNEIFNAEQKTAEINDEEKNKDDSKKDISDDEKEKIDETKIEISNDKVQNKLENNDVEDEKQKEEIKNEIITEENKIEETEKIVEENKNEIIIEKPKINEEERVQEDLFLKKYNEIINTEGNGLIKIKMDEIIQQVFGFYFNAYFHSYFDDIDSSNSLDSCDIFNENKSFLKICINYLETIKIPFKGKEISIFLASAFIQSFLYIFIKYFYKNINDKKEYIGNYDIGQIFDIIKGRSKFRRVVQIYVFRLIYNNIDNPTFEIFKKFDVKNNSYRAFVENFLEKYSFDEPPFKLLFYCKKIFEDFFFNDSGCLPKNYELKGYEFENSFPYDNIIINVKSINDISLNDSINCYENNSQFISRLAVLIISNAAKMLINEKEIKEINDELMKIFKNKGKYFNTMFNDAMFELTGDLQLNLIREFRRLLEETSLNDEINPDDQKEMQQQYLNINFFFR